MSVSRQERLSLIFCFLSYTIFGLSFLFSKQALLVASPSVLLSARFALSFLILNVMRLGGRFPLSLSGKPLGRLLVLGLIQPILYFIFENYGIRLSSTSFVGITLSLIPMMSVLFGYLILGERASALQMAGVAASVAGVFITTIGQRGAGGFSPLGFLLLLGAVGAASLFNVLSRKASAAFNAFERTYVMCAMGFVAFTAAALWESAPDLHARLLVPFASPAFWVAVAFLAILSSVGAFLMINYAAAHLSVAKVSIFANLTAAVTIFAGVLILREPFGPYEMLGSAVILISVYGVNRPQADKAAPKTR
jgi:drug/metabolite transporter (DMT)-like permease